MKFSVWDKEEEKFCDPNDFVIDGSGVLFMIIRKQAEEIGLDYIELCEVQQDRFKVSFSNQQMERRIKQYWMNFTQDEIDGLTEENWIHYKNGGCLCYAHCECECCCGSWRRK